MEEEDEAPSPLSVRSQSPTLEEMTAAITLSEPSRPRVALSSLYQPLDASKKEIRILRLFPFGQPRGMVHCSLETRSLDDKFDYNAVSYAWGDATETVELCCNYVVVRVTKALHSALSHMRGWLKDRDHQFELWIDGLCINQQDLAEQSSQVLLMGQIYRQATHTMVWLGPAADESDFVMRDIEAMGESETLDATKPETWTDFPALWKAGFWGQANKLFSRPFWTRMWVLQEIAVSSRVSVCCGDAEVAWPVLYRAHTVWSDISWNDPWKHFPPEIVSRITSSPHDRLGVFGNMRRKVQSRGGTALLVQLNSSLALRCADPRDKIYALLGISQDDDFVPVPDYTANVRDVYTELLANKLADGFNAVILLMAGSGVFPPEHRTCDGLPSWVVDWAAWSSCQDDLVPLYIPYLWYQRICYTASNQSDSTIRTTPGLDVLTTKGILCDGIATAQPDFSFSGQFWDRFSQPQKDATYPTGIPLLQAAFRTIVADNDRRQMERLGIDRELLASLIAGFFLHLYLSLEYMERSECVAALQDEKIHCLVALQRWQERHAKNPDDKPCTAQEIFLGDNWHDLDLQSVHEKVTPRSCFDLSQNRSSFNCRTSSFFHTGDGYFGLGPRSTEPGDDVFVLPGLSVPFVMRKHQDHYEMVGPCFVLGFMDGEAMSLVESGQRTLQDLVVR